MCQNALFIMKILILYGYCYEAKIFILNFICLHTNVHTLFNGKIQEYYNLRAPKKIRAWEITFSYDQAL